MRRQRERRQEERERIQREGVHKGMRKAERDSTVNRNVYTSEKNYLRNNIGPNGTSLPCAGPLFVSRYACCSSCARSSTSKPSRTGRSTPERALLRSRVRRGTLEDRLFAQASRLRHTGHFHHGERGCRDGRGHRGRAEAHHGGANRAERERLAQPLHAPRARLLHCPSSRI